MKHTKTILAAIVLSLAGSAYAQFPVISNGMTPVTEASVSKSALPSKAASYIGKYFPGENIIGIEQEFASSEYEVTLASGTELTFNRHGKITGIDAPDNAALSERVIRSILPHDAYRTLEKQNYAKRIENIKKTKLGYEVDVNDMLDTEIQFNSYGQLVAIGED